MIDAFALLDQPRRPWLDPEQLKQAFHAKALQAHPDASAQSGDDAAFARLNEAHQILQEPKRRLQHLLSLSGNAPDRRPTNTPRAIEDLFPIVTGATQRAAAAVQQSSAATTALSRSLLKPQLMQAVEQLGGAEARVAAVQQSAVTALQELDRTWEENQSDLIERLQELYLQFAYLTRWTAELDEKRTQLSQL